VRNRFPVEFIRARENEGSKLAVYRVVGRLLARCSVQRGFGP
jgi:hypothetical protein